MPRYGTVEPRAATAARALAASATRRSIHGRSSRTAAAASRCAARRGSTTSTPRAGSTVTRTRLARGERRTLYSIVLHGATGYGPGLTMPAFPALDEPLRDDCVALRYGAERDIPEVLIAHDDDPDLYLALGQRAAAHGRRAREPRRARAGGARRRHRAPGSRSLSRVPAHFLGELNFHHVDWENRRAEVGIWLTAAARGRGLGTRALRLAGEWLLVTCGFERVEALTDPGNASHDRRRPRGRIPARGRPAQLPARARPPRRRHRSLTGARRRERLTALG